MFREWTARCARTSNISTNWPRFELLNHVGRTPSPVQPATARHPFLPQSARARARPERSRRGARHTTYTFRDSSGTTFSSSFSVHLSTVRELLTPSRNPAFCAGLPLVTELTTTPVSWGRL